VEVIGQLDETEEDDVPVRRTTHQVLRAGMTPALRAQINANETTPIEEQAPEEALIKIPVTTLRTPTELVRQRVLVYDRYDSSSPILL
jgi:hypothetical protein